MAANVPSWKIEPAAINPKETLVEEHHDWNRHCEEGVCGVRGRGGGVGCGTLAAVSEEDGTLVCKPATCGGGDESVGEDLLAHEFEKLDHEVRLIGPQYVKPWVQTNESDPVDTRRRDRPRSDLWLSFAAVSRILST